MQTLDLEEAATFLKCSDDTVRELAASGQLPAAKVGRAWVFVDVDLVEWLRTQYNASCQTSKSAGTGTTRTSRSKGKGLGALLELPTRKRPAETATSSEQNSGKKNESPSQNVTRLPML
jgi:excisionase family DNA binding protein